MTGRAPARLAVAIAVASVALSAVPRVLLAADALPAFARPFVWSDALETYAQRLHGTQLPYFDAFFEYPPVVGYVSAVLVRATRDAAAYVAAWGIVSALAAAVVAVLLARRSPRAALLWSLSPQLLLYGAMNFDVLAVALLVWAIDLSRRGARARALAALAAGAVTKAFPALAAPHELLALRRERGGPAAAGGLALFLAVALAVALPSLIAPHPFTDGAAYVGGLTNFDSAWGIVAALLRGAGIAGAAPAIALISAAGGLVTYAWAVRRARGADLARGAALAVVAALIWTRLYSPQYSLWLVPFFALGALPLRAFGVLCLADAVVFSTVYPLTLYDRPPGGDEAALLGAGLVAGVVLRHAALIMAWTGRAAVTGAAPRRA